MKIDVLYFAWVRERIGKQGETVETSATTVRDLIADLVARDDAYALAFSDLDVVKAALDEVLVDLDTPLLNAREVAFFPPMTGG